LAPAAPRSAAGLKSMARVRSGNAFSAVVARVLLLGSAFMPAFASRNPGLGRVARPAVLAFLAVFALGGRPHPAAAQVRYVARLANRNKVGMTVTNYGFFGNNFTSRSASLEYPLGSGFEHM